MRAGLGNALTDHLEDLVIGQPRIHGDVGRGLEAPNCSGYVIHPLTIPHRECQLKGEAMSTTDDDSPHRAYLTAAADQIKQAIRERDADACLDVIRRMRHDGYHAEARATMALLANMMRALRGDGRPEPGS